MLYFSTFLSHVLYRLLREIVKFVALTSRCEFITLIPSFFSLSSKLLEPNLFIENFARIVKHNWHGKVVIFHLYATLKRLVSNTHSSKCEKDDFVSGFSRLLKENNRGVQTGIICNKFGAIRLTSLVAFSLLVNWPISGSSEDVLTIRKYKCKQLVTKHDYRLLLILAAKFSFQR